MTPGPKVAPPGSLSFYIGKSLKKFFYAPVRPRALINYGPQPTAEVHKSFPTSQFTHIFPVSFQMYTAYTLKNIRQIFKKYT